MITLTTAITLQNVTKFKVTKLRDRRDDDEPNVQVGIEMLAQGGLVYGPSGSAGPWWLTVTDSPTTCLGVRTTSSPIGLFDKIETFNPGVSGALTSLLSAVDAQSTRANKWKAAETALLASGIIGAGLSGTQS